MIDVWMIVSMMYPFCVVGLYSARELFKNRMDEVKPVALSPPKGHMLDDDQPSWIIKMVDFMLGWGLPILVMCFTILFWALGMAKREASSLCSTE